MLIAEKVTEDKGDSTKKSNVKNLLKSFGNQDNYEEEGNRDRMGEGLGEEMENALSKAEESWLNMD